MKKYLALLFFSLIGFLTKSQTFTLNITKGYGSGTYQKGDTIQIWSFSDKNSLTFNQWKGSATQYMLEQSEWLTRISVPINDTVSKINATASFNNLNSTVKNGFEEILLPRLDEGVYMPTLKKVFYQIPENPKGIIFCFHDAGESADEFETDFEKRSFFKAGANQNYIMIATDANENTDSGNKSNEWQIKNSLTDNENNNIDIHLIKILRDTLINRYHLPDNFPTFSMGVSNGGNFGDLCAAALNFNASCHMIGNGLADIYKNRPDATPVIFVESINNAKDESNNPKSALNNHKALLSRDIYSEFYWHIKTPIYSERFLRTTSLQSSKKYADSIFLKIKKYQTLVEKTQFLFKDKYELPENLFYNLPMTKKYSFDCWNQIKIMNAGDEFNSHFNNRILQFFNLQIKTSLNNLISKNERNSKVYEKPTKNNLFQNMEKNTSISVLSSSGKLVYQVRGISEINMNPFPIGVYYIKKDISGKTTLEIVVKEK